MSYSKERAEYLRKKKKVKRILLCILIVFLCVVCVFSSYYPAGSWKYYFSCPKIQPIEKGELRVHFLSVGQGDCTIVEFPDGKTMLVDGGTPYGLSVKTVMRYLNALRIKTLDYVVVTGTDATRCGALSEVAKYKKIEYVYYPKTKSTGSVEYTAFCTEAGRKATPASTAERYLRVDSKTENPYLFLFLLPNLTADEGDSTLWIEWQGYGILLFGKMDESTETRLQSDIKLGYFEDYGVDFREKTYLVKMANNGSASDVTKSFYDYLRPQAVVVSCLEGINFTPDEWAIPEVSRKYRTDLQGTIVATITKDGLTVKTEK